MWAAGTLLAVIPLAGGCVQEAASSSTDVGTNAAVVATNRVVVSEPATPVLEEPAPPLASPPPLAEPGTNRAVVPDQAAAENKPLPPGLTVSPALGEVVRMANGGVDPAVMLSYITNSTSTFNLGSDQIIYLKDIGLPAEVVTSMLLHDQALSSGQLPATASTVPAPTPVGAPQPGGAPADTTSVWQTNPAATANAYAPTYAGQPEPQAQPAPAPQAGEAVQAAPQPQQPVTTAYFQDNLAPYGNWVNVDGYGQCWQPTVTVINTAWRPYCDGGRWIYTDCGWYWQSDYAWGGVAFHYGRWFYAPRHGWCWWPNTVWGPSWVTWRSSSAYCGWAPLPPYSYCNAGAGFTYYGNNVSLSFGFGLGASCYTFMPWNGICHPRPWTCAVPPHRAAPIYHNTTVINNVVIGNHNTIVNRGVDVTHAAKLAGRDVPRGTVREGPPAARGIRPDHVERQGNNYVVYRPATSPARAPATASPAGNANASRPTSAPLPNASVNTRPAGAKRAPTAPTVAAESPRGVAPRPGPPPSTRPQETVPAPSATHTATTLPANRPGTRPVASPTPSGGHPATPAIAAAPTPTTGTARPQPPSRPTTVSQPARPETVGRPTVTTYPRPASPTPAARPTAPSVTGNTASVARPGSPVVLPYTPPARTYSRPTAPQPSTPAPVTRPSYNNYTPPQSLPTSRPSYSQAPTYSAPTRTYTAPAPVARPTYSAPTAPTPTYAMPTAPTRPAPATSSRSTTPSTGASRNANER